MANPSIEWADADKPASAAHVVCEIAQIHVTQFMLTQTRRALQDVFGSIRPFHNASCAFSTNRHE
jgi:hypothetical protein